jgi:hypothetical protein
LNVAFAVEAIFELDSKFLLLYIGCWLISCLISCILFVTSLALKLLLGIDLCLGFTSMGSAFMIDLLNLFTKTELYFRWFLITNESSNLRGKNSCKFIFVGFMIFFLLDVVVAGLFANWLRYTEQDLPLVFTFLSLYRLMIGLLNGA